MTLTTKPGDPMGESSSFEYLMGLHVVDEDGYARYREGMMPLLESYGGRFRYDIRNGEVLKSETPEPINRVFVLSFPTQAHADRFFSDDAYIQVRTAHFDRSVASTTWIATYVTS